MVVELVLKELLQESDAITVRKIRSRGSDAAKVIGNYSFVDKSRIGIFGWSYGGFMSSNCL
jgi:cephalosporin-C deacetylase-like acetyl esterase